jgi:hypothetical protein
MICPSKSEHEKMLASVLWFDETADKISSLMAGRVSIRKEQE